MPNFRSPVLMFIPRAGRAAPIVREGSLIRDLSMPRRDWRPYEVPAVERLGRATKTVAV